MDHQATSGNVVKSIPTEKFLSGAVATAKPRAEYQLQILSPVEVDPKLRLEETLKELEKAKSELVIARKQQGVKNPNSHLRDEQGNKAKPKSAPREDVKPGQPRTGRSYASFVSSNPVERELRMLYFGPVVKDGVVTVVPNEGVVDEAVVKWQD